MQGRGERGVDLLLSAETSEPAEALCLTLAAGRNGFCLSFPSASSSLPPFWLFSASLPQTPPCLSVDFLPLGHAFSGSIVNPDQVSFFTHLPRLSTPDKGDSFLSHVWVGFCFFFYSVVRKQLCQFSMQADLGLKRTWLCNGRLTLSRSAGWSPVRTKRSSLILSVFICPHFHQIKLLWRLRWQMGAAWPQRVEENDCKQDAGEAKTTLRHTSSTLKISSLLPQTRKSLEGC